VSNPISREAVAIFLLNVQDRLIKDLKAIPTERQGASPMGAGRAPLNIVAECAWVNQRVATVLINGVPPPRPAPEERDALLNSYDTEEKALTYLQTSTQEVIQALDALPEERLAETTEFPFGRPITLLFLAQFAAIHLMYHDGQLNYIHTLYGDTETHW
jgi:hypothetical protein